MSDVDFSTLIEPVAKLIWGENVNPKLSKKLELRWGSGGSRVAYLDKGTWHDYQEDVGGGVFALIAHSQGYVDGDKAACIQWLVDMGLIDERQPDRREERRSEPARPAEHKDESPKTSGKWTIVETYPYTDRDGNLLYEVCRVQWKLPDGSWELSKQGKPKKTFVQRRPSHLGDKSWVWSLSAGEFMRSGPGRDWKAFDEEGFAALPNGERQSFDDEVAHTIYRHPQVEIAIADNKVVLIPEGERKVHVAEELGFAATCNSGGAKNWGPHLAEIFRGADVVIPVDNDKTGREAGETKAASLRGIAKRVRVLDFAPHWKGMLEKADIVDWKAAGGTSDQLEKIIAGLPDWQPAPPATKYRAVLLQDIKNPSFRHEWLVDELIEAKGVCAMPGASKAGKSFLALHLEFCIALGQQFWGHDVKQGLVIHQAGEGQEGLAKRIEGYLKYNELEDRAAEIPFIPMLKKINLFIDDTDTDQLIAECRLWEKHFKQKLRLLTIDTFNKAITGANEISGQDMGKITNRLERLRDELECTVMPLHHMNAGGTKMRGHTSLVGDISNVIEVAKLESTNDQNGRPVRTFKLDKNKDGEDNKTYRFVLKQVILDPYEDGKQRTTCIVDFPAGSEEAAREGYRLTDQERVVYNALLTALAEHGEAVPYELRLPSSVVSVLKTVHWRDHVRKTWSFKEIESDTEEQRKARQEAELAAVFKRVGMSLFNAGIIGKDNDRKILWRAGKEVRSFKRAEAKVTGPVLTGQQIADLKEMDVPF